MKSLGLDLLVVEDVDEMREMLQQMLSAIPGVRNVVCAQNCGEARLELSRRRPHLVFLDEVLPGESSLDLLKELQSTPTRVVLMTGIVQADHAVPPGVVTRLFKPDWDSLASDQDRFIQAIVMSGLPLPDSG